VDLFEEAQVDKKPNKKNIQMPKPFMMASSGCAKRKRDRRCCRSSRSVAWRGHIVRRLGSRVDLPLVNGLPRLHSACVS